MLEVIFISLVSGCLPSLRLISIREKKSIMLGANRLLEIFLLFYANFKKHKLLRYINKQAQ